MTRKMKVPTRRGHTPAHDTRAMLWYVLYELPGCPKDCVYDCMAHSCMRCCASTGTQTARAAVALMRSRGSRLRRVCTALDSNDTNDLTVLQHVAQQRRLQQHLLLLQRSAKKRSSASTRALRVGSSEYARSSRRTTHRLRRCATRTTRAKRDASRRSIDTKSGTTTASKSSSNRQERRQRTRRTFECSHVVTRRRCVAWCCPHHIRLYSSFARSTLCHNSKSHAT